MTLTSTNVWFSILLLFITVIVTKIAKSKIAKRRINSDPTCKIPLPPEVNGISQLVGLSCTLFREGLQAMIQDLYTKFGSVFTINLFGAKLTFLVGPEVSAHFFQGLESEISQGNMFEFTVPMFGQEVAYAVDIATRLEQTRFYSDALKPSKLRGHVDLMVQEVEDYFAKWGHHGIVDLKQEMEQLLTFITSRCLLGKEVREKMFDEVDKQFHDLDCGTHFASILFPYIPIPSNRRRDKARAKLAEIFSEIVRSRRNSNRVEVDMLQNLIDSKYKSGRPTTEAEVTGMVIGLMFLGKHTSTLASTWTGAFLVSHAKCLTAAMEEQKQIITKYGDCISYDILLEMDTLHRCIKEAMRIQPTAKMNFRKVLQNFTVRTKEGNEYNIPKGHSLVSPTALNNSIPYIYKDPHVYDPDRFGSGREEDKVGGKFSYTSFGGGRHACLGEAYAYMQIKVIWSHLLRNFEMKLVSPVPDIQGWNLVPEPAGKVMVSYTRKPLPA